MYPKAQSIDDLRDNLMQIEQRIAAACARAGRSRAEVQLLPVSKTVPEALLRDCYQLGYRHFGENKVQEALQKAEAMQDLDVHWSVIGHLQSNKIKYVARFASEFQALDSLSVASALQQRLEEQQRELEVLIQINTSDEASKYGIRAEEADALVEALHAYPRLKVKGLMTLALLSEQSERVRDCFVLLRETAERLKHNLPDGMSMERLSMGMSGDFEAAIAEGATVVRVGQAIFGARAYPDSHYWPV